MAVQLAFGEYLRRPIARAVPRQTLCENEFSQKFFLGTSHIARGKSFGFVPPSFGGCPSNTHSICVKENAREGGVRTEAAEGRGRLSIFTNICVAKKSMLWSGILSPTILRVYQ